MRLGAHCFNAKTPKQLEELCWKLDAYGLSTIIAPSNLPDLNPEQCIEYGEKAKQLDIVVGEIGMWENLLTNDKDLQNQRINKTREVLKKSDLMGCHCVVSLVGTKHQSDRPLTPDAYMYTNECKDEFYEVIMHIMDGLQLKEVRYAIEPWHNTFFYQPEEIKSFLDRVDHPHVGLHLDQMNLVSQQNFYNTTELINRTFDLLSDKVAAIHLKDISYDYTHMFLKMDEVFIGDGVMDYDTYLKKIAALPKGIPCFCEHLKTEQDYVLNCSRAHYFAKKAGVEFIKRKQRS